jgi:DNA polymerase-3 subunit chi
MPRLDATRVDFYLVGAADNRAWLTAACRIAEKACEQGLRVAVRTASPSQTAEIDELMWTFSDRSFVPHGVWPADPGFAAETPVLIASGALPETHCDVLVNLADGLPADIARYGRVCEVVAGDEEAKRRARTRWRGYREAGLEPATHNV